MHWDMRLTLCSASVINIDTFANKDNDISNIIIAAFLYKGKLCWYFSLLMLLIHHIIVQCQKH